MVIILHLNKNLQVYSFNFKQMCFSQKRPGLSMSALELIQPGERSKPQLACFRASAEFIQRPHATDGPDNYRLAHGNVAGLRQDTAVNHAWVEELDFIYELSEGHKNLFMKDEYYKDNKIINVRTYTAKEATERIGEYGHWGPWN
jgi:hypothetical protein